MIPSWYNLGMKTELQKKLRAMNEHELQCLADRIDTSVFYLMGHIYYARRTPKRSLMNKLQDALILSDVDMFSHFYSKEKAA